MTTDLLHALTLGDVLREHARSRPRQVAAVDGETRLDYRTLDGRVNQLADRLETAGVASGERVCWLGQNSFRLLEALLAAAKLGAMFCPVNWRQSPAELTFVVDDLDPRVVLWQEEEVGASIAEARRQVRVSPLWVGHDDDGPDGYEAWREAGSPEDRERPVGDDAPLLIVYTAAFGGVPNGAMLSHTACISQGLVYGHFTATSASDVYLNSGPLFHLGTLMHLLATFVAGGTNVFVPRVDASLVCAVIDRERCTGAFVVGPMFEELLAVNEDGRYDLSSLRTPRGRPDWDAATSPDPSPWAARPGGYGQTEAVGMMTFNCLGVDADGTHGRPSPLVQIRVVDDAGRDVPDGEVGELVARGPTIMCGYWNRPEENARRHRDGWHHTHDLGRREPDGSLTFIGPKTRMIKSAAENIYPAEVERCVASHPAVAECAVIGVPDPRWVQSVKAVVVLRDGESVTADDLVEHCRARIAPYKKPRSVEFVDVLPRVGFAVDYDALDVRFGGGSYPGGHTRSA
ncbi:MAG TPA: AMP-binding protein [Acidimicrobiia bacterium]|nr:AMP-binding protein [Acidimicrobiia bacterium]